jgi:cytochrome c biogenesis protein CcmG/thiol:disulfide interchange protein DsbE
VTRRPGAALLAACLSVAALLLTACGGSAGQGGAGAGGGTEAMPAHSVLQACPASPAGPASGGTRLPGLQLRCLGGGTLDLASAPGVPMVVNLWGSWCAPCRDELPVVQQLADVAGGRVRVVGVVSKDGVPQAESFAEDAGLRFPSAFDGQGRLMTAEGLNALPVTFFVDPSGAVTYRQVGPVSSLPQLEQLVAAHLGVRL